MWSVLMLLWRILGVFTRATATPGLGGVGFKIGVGNEPAARLANGWQATGSNEGAHAPGRHTQERGGLADIGMAENGHVTTPA